jgi:hypothetical protein
MGSGDNTFSIIIIGVTVIIDSNDENHLCLMSLDVHSSIACPIHGLTDGVGTVLRIPHLSHRHDAYHTFFQLLLLAPLVEHCTL